MSRVAAIDIGTNSVLLVIAESASDVGGFARPVLERATITRIGRGVDRTRKLDPEGVARTLDCLRDYATSIREAKVSRLAVVGTSALRDASNGETFLREAEGLLGIRPQVIGGNEEARLTFRGALTGLSLQGPVLVVDIGGGSTEVIAGRAGERDAERLVAVSLDVGSVRLTERYLQTDPPSPAEVERVAAAVGAALALAPPPHPESHLVGVAGTVTTLATVTLGLDVYDHSVVHGRTLSRGAVDACTNLLAGSTLAERRVLPGLDPARADVIVGGAVILREVLSWAGVSQLTVSDRGVRWGLVERLLAD